MSMAQFSLYGLYQFDESLFDDITLPAPLDKETLINCIIEKSGELFPYHQSPGNFKRSITFWFKRNYSNFEKQINALLSEFNPIENYDRYEELKETPNISKRVEFDGSNTTVSNDNGTTEGKVSAFNSDEYEPSNLGTSSGHGDSTTSFNSGNTETESGTRIHENHIHGNIGVTTASAMIRETVELYSFDLYENIAQRFEKEFLIRVY